MTLKITSQHIFCTSFDIFCLEAIMPNGHACISLTRIVRAARYKLLHGSSSYIGAIFHPWSRWLFIGYMNYSDVIMTAMASQITSLAIVYSTVYSRGKSKRSSKLRVTGLCAGMVNSPHKWPVTRKMFPFDDVIMDDYKATDQISQTWLLRSKNWG